MGLHIFSNVSHNMELIQLCRHIGSTKFIGVMGL